MCDREKCPTYQLLRLMTTCFLVQAVPLEYNVWLAFRHLVDLILMNDFLAYSCFAWSWYTNPPQSSVAIHVLRWVIGWGLIYFNVIVKTDAHRVYARSCSCVESNADQRTCPLISASKTTLGTGAW